MHGHKGYLIVCSLHLISLEITTHQIFNVTLCTMHVQAILKPLTK